METSTVHLYIMIECLGLGFGHYAFANSKDILGPLDNPVRIIFNYTYGVSWVIGSFIGWLRDDLPTDPHQIGWYLTGFAVSGGAAVVFTYIVDWIRRLVQNGKATKIMSAFLERLKNAETKRNH